MYTKILIKVSLNIMNFFFFCTGEFGLHRILYSCYQHYNNNVYVFYLIFFFSSLRDIPTSAWYPRYVRLLYLGVSNKQYGTALYCGSHEHNGRERVGPLEPSVHFVQALSFRFSGSSRGRVVLWIYDYRPEGRLLFFSSTSLIYNQ